MNDPRAIDGVLVEWGERLFYPGIRRVTPAAQARLRLPLGVRAAAIRQKIRSTLRRAPQVMVKVTGGGRGMGAIAAHLRYISKGGRLQMEDDRGATREGREAVAEVAAQWRYAGSLIPQQSERREAFNIVLSMPRGPRLCEGRTRRPPLRDGAARPPGQPARAPEREGVVDAG